MKNALKIFFFLSIFFINLQAEDKKIELGIDEQLGKKLPLDLKFYDEKGKEVVFGDLIKKPTVFAFVYYDCPSICSPLLSSVAEIINDSDLQPGEDYNVITLSIDETENYQLAAGKKKNFLKIIDQKKIPENSWTFLTGDSANIKQLADASGFYFKREGENFIHSGAIIFISEEGIITRYLFPAYKKERGYSILPFDFKMAIVETSKGNVTPTIAQVLQFCFSYDPEGRSYVLNLTRIFGAGILFLAAIFIVFLTVKPKNKEFKKR